MNLLVLCLIFTLFTTAPILCSEYTDDYDLGFTDEESSPSLSTKSKSTVEDLGTPMILGHSDSISTESLSVTRTTWPLVPCMYDTNDQVFFKCIINAVPEFRSENVYIVSTMQDLRYIVVVLKPKLGPLAGFFRFEYNHQAIANDCKSQEEYNEYCAFINKLN